MKHVLKLFVLGVLSVFVVSCSSGGGGGGGNTLQELDVNVSGTFGNGGKFTATTAAAPAAFDATPVAVNQFLLTGRLDDGTGKVYNLTGAYNSETLSYVISAAATDIIFNIDGEINAAGAAQNATVVINEKQPDGSWQRTEEAVAIGTVTVDAVTEAEVAGIPAKWLGTWNSSHPDVGNFPLILAPFILDIHVQGQEDERAKSIIIIDKKSDSEYELILNDYELDDYELGDGWAKRVIKEDAQGNVSLLLYHGHDNDGHQHDGYSNISDLDNLTEYDNLSLTR